MFPLQQTYEDLKISVNATIKAVQLLLQLQVDNYSNLQRSIVGEMDSPEIRDFGYNKITKQNQKVF